MSRLKRHISTFRRGSIYVTVMGVSLLVMVGGLGALLAARVYARSGATANDFAEARICARAGIELGMLAIYNDPYWRTHFGNGAWFTNQPVGNGSFTLSAADPVDGDITNGENDPVVLTCTGIKGIARYVISMRMEVGPKTGSCLEVSACSASDFTIAGSTLTSNQVISSNTQVTTSGGATVNAAVEGYSAVTGTGYTQTTSITGNQRTLPDSTHVLDYYIANGTPISYSSLPQFKRVELISNESFETNTTGWYAMNGCTLQRSLSLSLQGLCALQVTNRDSTSDAAATDLPLASIIKGHSYAVSFPVYSAGAVTMQVNLTLTTTTGTFTFSTPSQSVKGLLWTTLATSANSPLKPTWTGTLLKATAWVQSSSASLDYYIDGLSFLDVTFPDGTYVIDGQLLTPSTNPLTSVPNSQGIYVINCGGQNVAINNSRIIGTLVMLNAGSGSCIEGSVIMEPAATNYPVLMTDSQITIKLSSAALSEDTLGVNFNPSGAPYPYMAGTGTSVNATCTDAYPSSLNGLIYSKQNLVFTGATAINGAVVSAGKIQAGGTSLTLQYNSIYLNNPPPGFTAGTVTMKPVPGTWQRTQQ